MTGCMKCPSKLPESIANAESNEDESITDMSETVASVSKRLSTKLLYFHCDLNIYTVLRFHIF